VGVRFLFGWQPGNWDWTDPLFQVVTYAILAIWIVWKKDSLADYHMDSLAVYGFVLFKPLQTLILPLMVGSSTSIMAFPQPGALTCWIIAGMVIYALRKDFRRLSRIRTGSWVWLLAGAVIGVALLIVASVAMMPWTKELPKLILDYTIPLRYLYMPGYAGIDEEFVFRGMLWGVLRRAGWQERWIWFFQAALFVSVHGYVWRSGTAIPSLLIIFAGGFVYGALAWRTRSVVTSTLAHTFYNCSGFLGVMVLQWLGF
jgi:membrane protease YdiL (CAAX protease family)